MSEIQSYLWDFTSVPSFFDDWNIEFNVRVLGGESYEFCFCDFASTNIEDCLTSNNRLNTTNAHIIHSENCTIEWDSEARTIRVKNDVEWNIGSSTYSIKALFLRKRDTGYVMGYCIHQNAFEVTNRVRIEDGTVLWSIQDGK